MQPEARSLQASPSFKENAGEGREPERRSNQTRHRGRKRRLAEQTPFGESQKREPSLISRRQLQPLENHERPYLERVPDKLEALFCQFRKISLGWHEPKRQNR